MKRSMLVAAGLLVTTVAIAQASGPFLFLRRPYTVQWGLSGDVPVNNTDFDGDCRADITVYRPSTGQWFILFSSTEYNQASSVVKQWGLNGDTPIAADYDGDGITDLAVYRPADKKWYISFSNGIPMLQPTYSMCSFVNGRQ